MSATGSVLDPLDLFSGHGSSRGYEVIPLDYLIIFDLGSADGMKVGFVNGTVAANIVEEEDGLPDSSMKQPIIDNYDLGITEGKKSGFTDTALKDLIIEDLDESNTLLVPIDSYDAGFIDGKKSGFTDRALKDLVTDEPNESNRLPTPIDNYDAGFIDGKNSGLLTGMQITQLSLDTEELSDILALSPTIFINGGYFTSLGTFMTKSQFVSTEDLQVVFPPFINRTDGTQFLGTDVVTLVVKKPNGTLLSSPPVPIFDVDVKLWTAIIPQASFLAGKWLILASSNGISTQGQNQVLTWGDYVDDIQETRQAALGRWRIDSVTKKLLLYEDDGVTIFKTYDLKDSSGIPSVIQIFERTPE